MSCGPRPLALLVADDLTGACDAGVPFAVHGLECEVLFDVETASRSVAEVVVINTDSRCDTAADAASKVRACARLVPAGTRPLLIKKIDSTLRGPVGAEIEAAMAAFETQLAIIAPAFPSMGRAIRDGALSIRDASGQHSLDVDARLRTTGLGGAELIPRVHEFSSAAALAARVMELAAGGARHLILDSNSDADLRLIARMRPSLPPVLWVGSGGLAAHLVTSLPVARRASRPVPLGLGGTLFLIGSNHPATQRQVEYLEQRGALQVIGEPSYGAGVAARPILASGGAVLLSVQRGVAAEDRTAAFAQAVCGVPVRAIVVTGGDTGAQVCRALGVNALQLRGEVAAGLPWGMLRGGVFDGVPIVTKSGGFGGDDALVRGEEFFLAASPQYARTER